MFELRPLARKLSTRPSLTARATLLRTYASTTPSQPSEARTTASTTSPSDPNQAATSTPSPPLPSSSSSSSSPATPLSPSPASLPPSATPQAHPPKPSPTTNIYKQFGRPFAKVFLGAMFTFQVLYYFWERMRLNEVREEIGGEIRALEGEVEGYRRRKGGQRGA